jgi:multimeric flavodoxin WrbA
MKVLAFNGSPKAAGNTFHALKMVMGELQNEGIETELIHVGGKAIRSCTACNQCRANRDEQCVLGDDEVNDWVQLMKHADGILLGSPVHYAGMGSTMKAFLDRAFYVSGANGGMLRHKVGAAVVAVRRSGGLPAFSQLNHYLLYAEMLMPTSNYWNVIHGAAPGEVAQDIEGMQIMRLLGRNMAYLLKLVEHGRGTIMPPAAEAKTPMSFIR